MIRSLLICVRFALDDGKNTSALGRVPTGNNDMGLIQNGACLKTASMTWD